MTGALEQELCAHLSIPAPGEHPGVQSMECTRMDTAPELCPGPAQNTCNARRAELSLAGTRPVQQFPKVLALTSTLSLS